MIPRLRRGAIVLCLVAACCLAGGPARAVETGPGSKNFNVPPGVPDHFSNETEPFKATPADQGPMPRSTVSRGPRSRHVVAHRGRIEHRRMVRGHAVRGRAVASREAHHGRAIHTASHAEHSRPVSHTRTAARPHPATAKRRG